MSTLTVPLSSSPPSTPDSHQKNDNSFVSNLSTTPAGAPPSAAKSFTPAGPPPSSVFGSSLGYSHNEAYRPDSDFLMDMDSTASQNEFPHKPHHPSKIAQTSGSFNNLMKNTNFGISEAAPNKLLRINSFDSGPISGGTDNGRYIDDPEDIEVEDREETEDEDYNDRSESDSENLEFDIHNQFNKPSNPKNLPTNDIPVTDGDDHAGGSLPLNGLPRGVKRSRGGAAIHGSLAHERKARAQNEDSAIPLIAKNIASQLGAAKLEDPDDLILDTEISLQKLNSSYSVTDDRAKALDLTLSALSEELKALWHTCLENIEDKPNIEEDYFVNIGPDDKAPAVLKAVFLASLSLQLHHPPAAKGKQAFATTRSNRSSNISPTPQSNGYPVRLESVPKVLVDWLGDNHDPYRIAITNLMGHQPNPTAHMNFWDLLFSMTLRGQISQVIKLLKKSDFKMARSAREDGQSEDGYHGTQLGNIDRAVNRAIQVLEHCPVVQDGDWNITGSEWRLFRKRVEQALIDLAIFAERRDRDREPEESAFEAENFGIKSPMMSLSYSTRRAESRVPWTVYQSLKTMYGILLGGGPEILSSAQDWVEAAIGLTVWWDGDEDDEEVAVGSLAMTRRSLRHSHPRGARLVDINPTIAYQRRLAFAFEQATEDSNEDLFKINSLNPVEVGLASVFQGNTEGVIGILRGWSIPIVSAVVEVASLGGWYHPSSAPTTIDGFNESDLMVLSSYGQPPQGLTRDSILVEYADAISQKDRIQGSDKVAKEGWELSIAVLTRLDDTDLANKKVSELLGRIPLSSDERADKVLDVCRDFDMGKEARAISERYADSIAERSDKYGTALLYYAKAHCVKKVKDVLDLLISLSLVQSLAFPPISSLDHNLNAFLFSPEKSLDEIANSDPKAAGILHRYLTGYATLRKFYDLRDEEVNLEVGKKPNLRPIARKKAAVVALLAVIDSAADNIHGGLYDEQRGSIVQVDGLLTLLGESLVFVDQPKRFLTLSQCFSLLKAIEDLQTVTSRIYKQCDECFQSTLAAYHGSQQAPPSRELLKKTVSCMTSSSGFSLVGSSMFDSGTSKEGGKTESGSGSGWLVKATSSDGDDVKRGWDWRRGMGREDSGDHLLRILRFGLAKEISRAWIEGEVV